MTTNQQRITLAICAIITVAVWFDFYSELMKWTH
ncbi:TMhelix containing protein [Vibrio phage 1.164.O._10N.261.51.A7]|nr:TMhelix containing protein [Vibrio phage 1.164.O._10N.261.51.A7]